MSFPTELASAHRWADHRRRTEFPDESKRAVGVPASGDIDRTEHTVSQAVACSEGFYCAVLIGKYSE
ncbi:hypothetical protein BRC77_08460 [Halobacteriales archaeon QH_8_64_26]|nr:MAG: hypothetical protein BRC77_08460 [Halobacteriales archaeon QH_8_64_26]